MAFFLSDMLPPDALADMKQSPAWALMEAVAPTLVYDNAVMGDGAVPTALAATIAAPTWILDGADSATFKCEAADALAKAMPRAKRKTLQGYGYPRTARGFGAGVEGVADGGSLRHATTTHFYVLNLISDSLLDSKVRAARRYSCHSAATSSRISVARAAREDTR